MYGGDGGRPILHNHSIVIAHTAHCCAYSDRDHTPEKQPKPPLTRANDGAGDKGGGRRRQEDQRADQLVRAPKTAGGGVGDDGLAAAGQRAVVVRQERAVLLGEEETGGDRVDLAEGGVVITGLKLLYFTL